MLVWAKQAIEFPPVPEAHSDTHYSAAGLIQEHYAASGESGFLVTDDYHTANVHLCIR